MQWMELQNEEQLNEITSADNCQVIIKHNSSCSISQGVLDRLKASHDGIHHVDTVYVLDLLAHRNVSQAVAGRFGVPHQSPQVLLIKNGRCIYHEWGYDISAEAIGKAAGKAW